MAGMWDDSPMILCFNVCFNELYNKLAYQHQKRELVDVYVLRLQDFQRLKQVDLGLQQRWGGFSQSTQGIC